jgi:hypothetical protein
MDKNHEAKREFRAYIDDAKAKVAFLGELAQTGHKDEAMTLCLVYIDRFAQKLFWSSNQSGRNFVNALIQYGGDSFMRLCHPEQAVRAFAEMKEPWRTVSAKIAAKFPGEFGVRS